MASEISATVQIRMSKGGLVVDSAAGGSSITVCDMAGDDAVGPLSQVIGTSDEALDIPSDISPVGLLMVKNLGANFVELSIGTGGSFAAGVFAKLRPSQPPALIPSPGTTIYAKADTAATRVSVTAIEE